MKKALIVTGIMVTFLCGEIVYANRRHHVNQNHYTENVPHDEVQCENCYNGSTNCSKREYCFNGGCQAVHHYNNVNQNHGHYYMHH